MIIDIHEKYDVSPEWFEEQAKRTDGWAERLCELLVVIKSIMKLDREKRLRN